MRWVALGVPVMMWGVGIYGRSGEVVDALGIRCDSPGGPPTNGPLLGGSSGDPSGPLDCPEGTVLVGLQGTEIEYFFSEVLSSVTGVCADTALRVDDTALGNADRVRVTGTFMCPAGEVFVVEVVLTQDGTSGSGSARGTCTGESQTFAVDIRHSAGPGSTPNPAEACLTARNASPGARTVNDEVQTCESVTLVP